MSSAPIAEVALKHRHNPQKIKETLNDVFGRIEQDNAKLNAIVHVFEDAASERAKLLIEKCDQYKDKPLYGVPVTIKESFAYKSSPTTINFPSLKNNKPEESSVLAERLEEAGAIIVGKTNVPTMLADCQTFGPLYPTANNPYDITRTPGGSTGGGAASLAAEFSFAEIGSDIGGSIRNPSNFCGLYGLKPTQNGHIHDGHVPPLPGKDLGFTALNSTGPLARSVSDLKAIYDVCYQPMPQYQQYMRVETDTPKHQELGKYKVAYFDSLVGMGCSRATKEGLARIIKALEDQGASVEKISIDDALAQRILQCWVKLFGFVAGQDFSWPIRKVMQLKFNSDLKGSNIEASKQLGEGLSLDFKEYSKALLEQKECTAEFFEYFENYDFILSPTTIGPAFEHNHRHKPITIDGQSYAYSDYCFGYVLPYNLMGNPVLCVPSGLDEVLKLPVGISVAAKHHSEQQLLHFGSLLEAQGFAFQAPDLSAL